MIDAAILILGFAFGWTWRNLRNDEDDTAIRASILKHERDGHYSQYRGKWRQR